MSVVNEWVLSGQVTTGQGRPGAPRGVCLPASPGTRVAVSSRQAGVPMHVAKAVRSFRRDFAVVLASGFRDHTVVIIVDGREVYRRTNVRTSPATQEADTFVAVAECPKVHIEVRVGPGDLAIAAECDLR